MAERGILFAVKLVLRLVLGLVAVLLLGAGSGYVYLRQSLPKLDGDARLTGLSAPAEIQRDRYGIPHIRAQRLADAVFALGFAHAQDRLWQMEMNRRIAAGRLAEIIGP